MVKRDIVVVGASAGGIEALKQIVKALPASFPAAIFVVLHLPSAGPSALPRILSRFGALPSRVGDQGAPIEPGHIYVAPPDAHLLVRPDRVVYSHAPRENGFRPAVDPLFRSAARAFGARAIGIVLSGTGDDGTLGLLAIKQRGGLAIVQDPEDALFSGMPLAALRTVAVDYTLPVAQIPPLLVDLVNQELPEPTRQAATSATDLDKVDHLLDQDGPPEGQLTPFVCPECGGPIREIHDKRFTRYRCRIGHVYSPEDLMVEKTDALERSLWSAVRALEERCDLARRLARRMRQSDMERIAVRFDEQEAQSAEAAQVIRQLLLTGTVSNEHVPHDKEDSDEDDDVAS